MSSPFHLYTHMDSSTTLASTFTAFTEDTSPPADTDQTSDDLSVRSMNLKVLYSFDEGNKTNCLARWPHALDIRVAALDDTAEIGVIELKTCIQAIVNARFATWPIFGCMLFSRTFFTDTLRLQP